MDNPKYVANVPMQDQRGNEVNGVGVVSSCGTFLVACIARPGQIAWRPSGSGTGFNRTIGFSDLEVYGFQQVSDAQDENGFVEGIIGGRIISHTPGYVMQTKDGQGNVNDPFVRCFMDYTYQASNRGDARPVPFTALFPEEMAELVDEAINKAAEILNTRDEKGEVIRQVNVKHTRAASAFIKVTGRSEQKRGQQTTKPGTQVNVVEETMSAEDVIPE